MNASSIALPALAVLALLSMPAWAHDDATLDTGPSPHGGQVRMSGPHHFELVLTPGGPGTGKPVVVYLSDHAGKAVSSEGVTGVVTLLHGGKNAAVTIRPDGIDRLSGYVHFIPNAQLQIVVTLTFKDGVTRTATFTPFARPSSAAAGSRDGHASHHQ